MQKVTLQEVRDFAVPDGTLGFWFLGQASFLLKSPGGTVVAIDPYLTNSCGPLGEQIGINMNRMVPPPLSPEELVGIDYYVLTHTHEDHLDAETHNRYRAAGGAGPYIAPPETVVALQKLGVPAEEIEMTWPNKMHTVGDMTFQATFAIPPGADDLTHVGYKIKLENGPLFYFTGDTGYHDILVKGFGGATPDVMVTVINPAFSNMSPQDAATLAHRLDAQIVIPSHYDLFPGNSLPPTMLRTNMTVLGIGDRYRELQHGVPAIFPEAQ